MKKVREIQIFVYVFQELVRMPFSTLVRRDPMFIQLTKKESGFHIQFGVKANYQLTMGTRFAWN